MIQRLFFLSLLLVGPAIAAPLPTPAPQVPTCYSAQDIYNTACRVICIKDQQHYEGGTYEASTKNCVCYDKRDFDIATSKTLTLPHRVKSGYHVNDDE